MAGWLDTGRFEVGLAGTETETELVTGVVGNGPRLVGGTGWFGVDGAPPDFSADPADPLLRWDF